jgi:hypothetical protein
MAYKFKVFIDGNYYDDDEEYEVEIDLSDEEYVTIKRLVDEFGYDFSCGLMPILKDGPGNVYHKFYDTIFPHVFFKFFSRDDLFEPVPGDENKVWHEEDFDYLIKTYGDNYYLDDSYIVFIPDKMLPPAMKLSKGMNNDELLLYIRKWNSTRKDIFQWIIVNHDIHYNNYDALYEIIERRLLKIAEKEIKQCDETILSEEDYDPFDEINSEDIADEIYYEFQEVNV